MTKRILTATVTAGLLALASPVPAAAARSTCHPRGTEVLAGSSSGRVYAPGGDPSRAVACLFRSGRRAKLAGRGEPDPEVVGRFTIAGRFAAWYEAWCDPATSTGCSYQVLVLDIETQGVRRGYSDGEECVPSTSTAPECGEPHVSRIVLKLNGAAAWTTCDGEPLGPCPKRPARPTRVVRMDARGVRLLDASRDIHPSSLRLEAGRRAVSWTRAGERRSASLR